MGNSITTTDTTPETQVFETENVRFTVSRGAKCTLEYKVFLKEDSIKKAQTKAINELRLDKRASFKGFRKESAPESLFLKQYPGPVKELTQKELVNVAIELVGKVRKFPTIRPEKPRGQTLSFTPTGAEVVLVHETVPVVPSIDLSKVVLEEVPPLELKVDETIRQCQMYTAKWNKVDRAAKEGDFVLLDLDTLDGPTPGRIWSNTRFEMTKTSMAQYKLDALKGKKAGDIIETVSVPNADETNQELLATPPTKVRITLLEVQECQLPPLDDNFANLLGLKTVSEVRDHITKQLQLKSDRHVRQQLHDQVTKHLLESYAFPVPQSLIEQEAKVRYNQLQNDQEFIAYVKTLSKQQFQDMIGALFTQSEKAIRIFFISQKIAEEHKLQISADDLPPPPEDNIAAAINPRQDFSTPHFSAESGAEVRSQLLMEKACDLVVSHAKIVPTEALKAARSKHETTPSEETAPEKPAAKKAPKKEAASATAEAEVKAETKTEKPAKKAASKK